MPEQNQVKITRDYNLFKMVSENRDIKEVHVKKLTESISENNLMSINPIIVNENFEIIDGQHRYLACKKLNVPIYYFQSTLTHDDIAHLNSVSERWRSKDFLEYYSKIGKPEFLRFKDFLNKHNLTFEFGLLLTGYTGKGIYASIRDGSFTLSQKALDRAESVLSKMKTIIEHIENCSFDEKKIRFAYKLAFLKSLRRLVRLDDYNEERMLNNISLLLERLRPCASEEAYAEMLLYVYNYRRQIDKIELPSIKERYSNKGFMRDNEE